MNRVNQIAIALTAVLALSVGAVIGCKGTTKAGTSYTVLPTRELQSHVNGNVATVHDTALGVLRDDFGYQIKHEAKDALEGIIDARTARNDSVRVETFKEGDNLTTLQVFSGPLGDEGKSRQILNAIEDKLPK